MGGFFLLKNRADVFGLPQTTMAYLIMLALQRMQNSGRRRRQKRRKSKKKRKKKKEKERKGLLSRSIDGEHLGIGT